MWWLSCLHTPFLFFSLLFVCLDFVLDVALVPFYFSFISFFDGFHVPTIHSPHPLALSCQIKNPLNGSLIFFPYSSFRTKSISAGCQKPQKCYPNLTQYISFIRWYESSSLPQPSSWTSAQRDDELEDQTIWLAFSYSNLLTDWIIWTHTDRIASS